MEGDTRRRAERWSRLLREGNARGTADLSGKMLGLRGSWHIQGEVALVWDV